MYKIRDSLVEERWKKIKSDNGFLLLIAIMLSVVTLILFLNTYVFFNVKVLGPSMNPTLNSGDVLVANRNVGAEYGDIIIIEGEKSDWLIKRVIGKGGDTITIQNGYVYRNGGKLTEPYLAKEGITFYPNVSDKSHVDKTVWVIPEGEIFYLGDNRTNSSDSRAVVFGTCKESQVVGVVEEWSISVKGLLKCLAGKN